MIEQDGVQVFGGSSAVNWRISRDPSIETSTSSWVRTALLSALAFAVFAAPSYGQDAAVTNGAEEKLVQVDFDDVELAAVIETIAKLTNKNFIYDDRVRGRVTVVSPSPITVEAAYAVFESMLQVKGFTTVPGPGGVIKVIPIREAKESSIETVREGKPSPNRDHFVTRLIPLRYIDAADISTTLKPLVSKDAAMVAYPPTNTLILTDSAANIRRLMSILDAIDVSSYREELAVIPVIHADAAILGHQVSEIYGAEISSGGRTGASRRTTRRAVAARNGEPAGGNAQRAPGIRVRIITDTRTNSLLVLAPRKQLQDVRELVIKLDVKVEGGGSIHVYYLRHADAEELAQTLSSLLSGQRGGPSAGGSGPAGGNQAGGGAPALRSVVTELSEGITLTADPGTNSLVIQASKEAYRTLSEVIALLDIQRPQVLVEALIMEVDVSDGLELGFNAIVDLLSDWEVDVQQVTDEATAGVLSGAGLPAGGLGMNMSRSFDLFSADNATSTIGGKDTTIQAILRASASDGTTNVISAPHILTSDNEEAEIKIGNNIPIVTSRLDGATGGNGLSTSSNVERKDIGVTLRVTPQISEGDTLRLKIYQEITDVNEGLSTDPSIAGEGAGPALTNTKIENTLVVSDGETVVIGGLISDNVDDTVTKVPFLGDIPILGWAFKTTSTKTTKQNLLLFLTPHIVRSKEDLERATIRKREEFAEAASEDTALDNKGREKAEASGIDLTMAGASNPVEGALESHRSRYPLERMLEIEGSRGAVNEVVGPAQKYSLQAGIYSDESAATAALSAILEAGHEATLVTTESDGALLYELRVGRFDSLDEAKTASAGLKASFGLEPSVRVLSAEEQ
ncbi:MAG: type II secretion system secretin GspD [Myxococcota bacterium]|nr:type II secretion system secretin GspD [Myxococcota bacterium]